MHNFSTRLRNSKTDCSNDRHMRVSLLNVPLPLLFAHQLQERERCLFMHQTISYKGALLACQWREGKLSLHVASSSKCMHEYRDCQWSGLWKRNSKVCFIHNIADAIQRSKQGKIKDPPFAAGIDTLLAHKWYTPSQLLLLSITHLQCPCL